MLKLYFVLEILSYYIKKNNSVASLLRTDFSFCVNIAFEKNVLKYNFRAHFFLGADMQLNHYILYPITCNNMISLFELGYGNYLRSFWIEIDRKDLK